MFICDKNFIIRDIPAATHVFDIDKKILIGQNISALKELSPDKFKEVSAKITDAIVCTHENLKSKILDLSYTEKEKKVHLICYISLNKKNGDIYCHILNFDSKTIIDSRREFIDDILIRGMNNIHVGLYTKFYTDDLTDYKYIFFNNEIKQYFGKDDIRATTYWNQEEEDEKDYQVIKTTLACEYEKIFFDENNLPVKFFNVTKKAVIGEAGYKYVLTTYVDITALKEAAFLRDIEEQRIAKFRKSLDIAFEMSYLSTWVYDIKTSKAEILSGHFPFETGYVDLLDKFEYLHADDVEKYISYVTDIINGVKKDKYIEVRFKIKDEFHYCKIAITLITDENGNPSQLIGIVDDINQIYELKEILEEGRKKTEMAIATSGLIQWEYDCISKMVIATGRQLNYDNDIFPVNKFIQNLRYTEDIESYETERIFHGNLNESWSENVIWYNDDFNQLQNLVISGTPLKFDDQGNVIKYTGLIRDNTSQTIMENQLKDTNARLQIVLSTTSIIPVEWNLSTDYIEFSNSVKKDNRKYIHEVAKIHKNKVLESIHPSDRDLVLGLIANLKNGEDTAYGSIRYDVNKSFTTYYEIHLLAIRDAKGVLINIIGCLQDITQRKLVEIEKENNESFLKSILEGIPFPVYVVDVENKGKYTYWNKESYKLFGDGLNKNAYELFSTKQAIDLDDGVMEVYESGRPIFKQEHIVAANGKEIDTLVTRSVIYRYDKPYVLVVRWDITDILELQRSEKLLTSSLKYLNGYTWRLDLDKFVFQFGEEMQMFVDNIEDFAPLENYIKRMHPDDGQEFRDLIYKYMQLSKGEFSFSFRVDLNNSGEYVWHESRGMIETKIVNGEERKFMFGIDINIQEHKTAQEKLTVALAKAEESDRLKLAFLANMSHEIRTPLNAIVGFSNLLSQSDDEDEKSQFTSIINTNNELLLRLINDILELSKIESNTLESHYEKFDMAHYFDEVVRTMQFRITNPEVKLISENPFKSFIITVDKVRMTEVITNFVTNSIKYTPRGYIKMGYEYIDHGIRIYVEDTGIGIAEEKKKRVFQRFEKLDSYAQGTGLGLSICKALTEMDNGKVGFNSTEGVGSTFWAWRPLSEVEIDAKETDAIIAEYQPVEEDNNINLQNDNKMGKKILIAEDNDSNFMLVNAILKKEGEITRAINGLEAIEKAKEGTYDIIFMDVRMPQLDGLEATQEIRKFNGTVPIIALTANAFDSDRVNAINAGCNDFLTKPVKKSELIDMVNKY